jgi:hypothetical protein
MVLSCGGDAAALRSVDAVLNDGCKRHVGLEVLLVQCIAQRAKPQLRIAAQKTLAALLALAVLPKRSRPA